MKLKTPFSVIKNSLSDIQAMDSISYTIPTKTRDKFWHEDWIIHPNKLTSKTYDV